MESSNIFYEKYFSIMERKSNAADILILKKNERLNGDAHLVNDVNEF